MTVNAYFISATIEYSPDEDEYSYFVVVQETLESLVFAHSRGQARAMFCEEHNLEFTNKMSILLIRKDVRRSPRIAEDDNPVWFEVTAKLAQGSLPTDMLIPDTLQEDER